ncbi:single-stranded DNA-binding protein [Leucobacter sp. G161]|uniref:single-stranded DNA-binding protein n=1 Tax=Leucobacter sp. G161 TaxID=663704 RepID=UPI00073AFABC|nr:single-stranded DNA-binding protein [Leucobacter sp. G161]KUF05547.1 hypothetical protein AUL38_04115 [Leucobacter sp. G161]
MATADITIEGFVAKPAETRQAGSGTVTTITVPVEQGRMKDAQWVPDTDKAGQKITHWWEAEFWNEYGAQVGQEIQKGYLVHIEGEPRPRAYVKNDGTAGIALTIVNPTISIIVRRPSRQQPQGGAGVAGWATAPSEPLQGGTGDPGAFGNFGPDDENPF